MSWTAGYVADVDYIYGYYNQLNPAWARLALLLHGVKPRPAATACELGFGQGLAIAIHAAAQPQVQWWGTDFNPTQAAVAQSLAETAGIDHRFFDQSFEEFCNRADLPDFDYIGLHGIWTWVSDENRAIIVDFIRRKLKVGGQLYVSYNTLPGWAETIPLRRLIADHAASLGAPGHNSATRFDAALTFAQRLFALNPQFVQAHPQLRGHLEQLTGKSRHYLSHEYLTRDWHPMDFTQIARWLEPAKLSYVCSAGYNDNIDQLNLDDGQIAFLKELEDPILRETVRDFMTNRRFRRDCWVKGPLRVAPLQLGELVLEQEVVLLNDAADVTMQASGARGDAPLDPALYAAVLQPLADHAPHPIADLVRHAGSLGIEPARVIQAVAVLIGKLDVLPAQNEDARERAGPAVLRLNEHIASLAQSSDNIGFLANPATGGGIPVERFEQLFLLARSQGLFKPEEWGSFAWDLLSLQGQPVYKDGEVLATPQECLAELQSQAAAFAAKRLPIFKAQGVAVD
jgi:SAM-dependent methyltransferase